MRAAATNMLTTPVAWNAVKHDVTPRKTRVSAAGLCFLAEKG